MVIHERVFSSNILYIQLKMSKCIYFRFYEYISITYASEYLEGLILNSNLKSSNIMKFIIILNGHSFPLSA